MRPWLRGRAGRHGTSMTQYDPLSSDVSTPRWLSVMAGHRRERDFANDRFEIIATRAIDKGEQVLRASPLAITTLARYSNEAGAAAARRLP